MEQTYLQSLTQLNVPSFQAIRNLAKASLSQYSSAERDDFYNQLNRGKALLTNHNQLCQYLFSFGNMHEAKLEDALNNVPRGFWQQDFEIVDWGCGQAIGTLKVFDLLRTENLENQIKKITLIEPSPIALKRAAAHVAKVKSNDCTLITYDKFFENLEKADVSSQQNRPRLHIFSNILDVEAINLKALAGLLDNSANSEDCIVAVSPIYTSSHRVEAFKEYFEPERVELHYAKEIPGFMGRSWTYLARIWTLNSTYPERLRNLKYYPAAHYKAAYLTDLCFVPEVLKQIKLTELHKFAVSARFALGDHIYKDLNPLFAVLHNIIVRGTPTRASPFIESVLAEAFQISTQSLEAGSFEYTWHPDIQKKPPLAKVIELLHKKPDIAFENEALANAYKQFIYSPIAIGRFHKVLLEALLTEKLDIGKSEWRILVEEKDVPFAALAIEDFKQMFESISGLLDGGESYQLPRIILAILGSEAYKSSPLHLNQRIILNPTEILNETFDLVITQAIFQYEGPDMDDFEKYKVTDSAYFHIRSTSETKVNRYLYTTDLIAYQPLVEKDERGNFNELKVPVSHLEYFLQLFFRKQSFRPGQLPILDRALRRLPVIGLLPTGGGKSLTYQIAALLQPGLTMVVDPLKSLMKDQFEGLLRVGIDAATYINSSLNAKEKKENELKLESSQVLFTFLSPERLGISSFRERLEKMYDRDAYFSYGVIDEVHCVSEWGHDFRFNYLHLGRNLYQHVKSRSGRISLFGLTATASFDVLADVERELSANGAFELDADTTVRFENTNRLELQYKIERVPISFGEDTSFDNHGALAAGLPRAINANYTFGAFDSKKEHLTEYLFKVPEYLQSLLRQDSIDLNIKRFYERQNIDKQVNQDLEVNIDPHFWQTSETYKQAGIVFCPHVQKTGVSVHVNSQSLIGAGVTDLCSYTGQDDDSAADESLTKFRENKSPLMVATKAFGMGIDKPNVRYTINMNYSSSLEAFVQEAGRAGRDQKMALSTILFSDYKIAQLSRNYPVLEFPVGLLYDRWFEEEALRTILDYYELRDYENYIITANPNEDIVKLRCRVNDTMFKSGVCNATCSEFKKCDLRKVNQETRGWLIERDLLEKLKSQSLNLSKKDFDYLSPDYGANMFFYSSSFKGDVIEKSYMHRLLSIIPVAFDGSVAMERGFLNALIQLPENTEVRARISYIPDKDIKKAEEHNTSINRQSDLSKAIYRLTCIGLIDDFTQDYSEKQFEIGLKRKPLGGYYNGLESFLKRYFTAERARAQIEEVKLIDLKKATDDPLKKEIYQCLNFLIQFIYEKISEKRKRAINDIRTFCLIGLEKENWIEANEDLKDFIYYYFNSKYARRDYVAPNNEPFSLVDDTEEGKFSAPWIVSKYLRIIDDADEAVASETPLDNVKHLHGAIRLLSRSLTDTNPALNLLETFCLAYLNPGSNKNLITQLEEGYLQGMTEFYERLEGSQEFWKLFHDYNKNIRSVWSSPRLDEMIQSIELVVHAERFKKIKSRYLLNHE